MSAEQQALPASDAVGAAVRARQIRAEVKAGLDFSADSLRAVLAAAAVDDQQGQAIARMPVRELLAAMPGVGEVRASAMLESAGVPPNRRLRGLGPKQADRLAVLITQRRSRRAARHG